MWDPNPTNWKLITGWLLVALVISVCVSACDGSTKEERRAARYAICKFQEGELVRSKLSGDRGQITDRIRFSSDNYCYYHVRFVGRQETTDSRILSNDGPIAVTPLTVIKYMRSYELEPWGE